MTSLGRKDSNLRIGRSQASMTLETYSHVGADLLGDAAVAMNATLRPAERQLPLLAAFCGAEAPLSHRRLALQPVIGDHISHVD